MFSEGVFGVEFFEGLERADREIAGMVAAEGCSHCQGPLYRGDYDRKPRGGVLARAGETSVRRYSLCCGREGCRRRATPPSVRFLGRRVYVGAVVIAASVLAHAATSAATVRAATGVPARTTRRWLRWWNGPFLATAVYSALCSRLVGLRRQGVPASMVERATGSAAARMASVLRWVAPLTTATVTDGARFVRGAV